MFASFSLTLNYTHHAQTAYFHRDCLRQLVLVLYFHSSIYLFFFNDIKDTFCVWVGVTHSPGLMLHDFISYDEPNLQGLIDADKSVNFTDS